MSDRTVGIVIGASLSKSFTKTFKRADKIVDGLEKRTGKLGKSLKSLSRDQSKLERTTDKATRSGDKQNKTLRKTELAKERNESATRQLSDSEKRLNDQLKKQIRTRAKLGKMMSRGNSMKGRGVKAGMMGAAATGGGLVAGRGLFSLGNRAGETESQLTEFGTLFGEGSKENAKAAARKRAQEIAATGLASYSQSIELQYNLVSAGIQEKLLDTFALDVTKVAKVARGQSDTVGEVMATTFNNMGGFMSGTDSEKFARIGDVLTQTQLKFQIKNFDQLGEGFKEAAASMKTYQVSVEEGAAAIGLLNTAGIMGSRAGTAMNAVLRNMSKASKELGFELIRDEKGMLDFAGSIEGLDKSLEGLGVDERATLLQKLFGDEGMKGIAPLLSSFEQLRDTSEGFTDGVVDERVKDFLDDFTTSWNQFKETVRKSAVTLGESLMPVLKTTFKIVGTGIKFMAKLAEKGGVLTDIFGAVAVIGSVLAVILGSGLTVFGLMSFAVGGLTTMLAGLGITMGAVAAAFLTVIGPILVIGGVIALVAFQIVRYWEDIKWFFSNLGKAIPTMVGMMFDKLKPIFKWSPLGIMIRVWSKIPKFIGNLFEGLFGIVGRFADRIGAIFGKVAGFFGFAQDEESKAAQRKARLGEIDSKLSNHRSQIASGDDRFGLANRKSRKVAIEELQLEKARLIREGSSKSSLPSVQGIQSPSMGAVDSETMSAGSSSRKTVIEDNKQVTIQVSNPVNGTPEELALAVRGELDKKDREMMANQRDGYFEDYD